MFSYSTLLGEAGALARMIIEVVIFTACVMYRSRTKTVDSRLLFIGSLIALLVRVFYVASPLLANYESTYDSMTMIFIIGNLFSFVGGLLFSVGFFRLVQGLTRKGSSSGFGTLDS
jgi:uncharacterized membrane protein